MCNILIFDWQCGVNCSRFAFVIASAEIFVSAPLLIRASFVGVMSVWTLATRELITVD